MQAQLAFLQQQLLRMSKAQVARCSNCDQLEGRMHEYRAALQGIVEQVQDREDDLTRRS